MKEITKKALTMVIHQSQNMEEENIKDEYEEEEYNQTGTSDNDSDNDNEPIKKYNFHENEKINIQKFNYINDLDDDNEPRVRKINHEMIQRKSLTREIRMLLISSDNYDFD